MVIPLNTKSNVDSKLIDSRIVHATNNANMFIDNRRHIYTICMWHLTIRTDCGRQTEQNADEKKLNSYTDSSTKAKQ